jgi:carboxymethylenebutenolidase
MRHLFLLSIILCSFTQVFAQAAKTCCSAHASNQFAMLSSNEGFRKAHEEPLKKEFTQNIGRDIAFACADGKEGKAFEIEGKTKSTKYLLVFHEWWGLNAHIKDEAVTLSKKLPDWNIIAVDLYDGTSTTNREEAAQLMQGLNPKRAEAIIGGIQKKIGKNAKIATLGWCMGGGWSLQAAIAGGSKTVACVMYYGFPEKEVAKLKTLKSDVVFVNATQDKWITKEVVEEFKANMKSAGKKLTLKDYDAPHAFANPSNPNFNQAFTQDAMNAVIKYLQQAGK